MKSSKNALGINVFPAISAQLISPDLMKLPTWAGVLILVLAGLFAGPVVASLAFGLGLAGVICGAVGIGVAISGVVDLSPAGALFQVGGGLISTAVGILLILGVVAIVWGVVKFVSWFWKSCVEGGV